MFSSSDVPSNAPSARQAAAWTAESVARKMSTTRWACSGCSTRKRSENQRSSWKPPCSGR